MADCYEAKRNDGMSEKERANANNAKNLRNAADVAMATKNPYAVAIGGAVKAADKLTGGKSTDLLGKGMTSANKLMPGGKRAQNLSNKLAESGVSDKAGKAASMYNSAKGQGGGPGGQTPNQVKTPNGAGGGQESSLPSSGSGNKNTPPPTSGVKENKPASDENANSKPKNDSFGRDSGLDDNPDKLSLTIKLVLFIASGGLILLMMALIGALIVGGFFSDYEDAIGVSQTVGEDNGNIAFRASTKEQQEFYDRINDVKLSYQANGKTVDALKVVAVYHILAKHNAKGVTYEDMSESDIKEIADAMFSGNVYNEDTFKNNLTNSIFPKYFPNASDKEISNMVDEVFDYIDSYNRLIGKDQSSCNGSSGSCNYSIKGYYISNKGNVTESLEVSDLYVRLMQCGGQYGGTYGQPLDGEELVPFEKYILGVAHLEVGESFHAEAQKAEMVAARSYALARHADMGGWRTLKQESDGKWVLQVASCTADQVYCDPDQGCSGSNNQWAQIHSGLNHGTGFSRGPLAEDSPMRTYASETEGEVLVNSQGYIIYTTYIDKDQNNWNSLAKSGLNYKQILLQYYNQGSKSYGASDVVKANCGGSSSGSCNTATGDYVNWKQYEGSWTEVPMGTSGKTIRQIGCLATSIAIQIARSGVSTTVNGEFNPGTFVEVLNSKGGFANGGNFVWGSESLAAPNFNYSDDISVSGWSKQAKLDKIKELTSQDKTYVVAEVKGNTGQHWVAIDHVEGNTVKMFDPGSSNTDLWAEYNWANTSRLVVFKAS